MKFIISFFLKALVLTSTVSITCHSNGSLINQIAEKACYYLPIFNKDTKHSQMDKVEIVTEGIQGLGFGAAIGTLAGPIFSGSVYSIQRLIHASPSDNNNLNEMWYLHLAGYTSLALVPLLSFTLSVAMADQEIIRKNYSAEENLPTNSTEENLRTTKRHNASNSFPISQSIMQPD